MYNEALSCALRTLLLYLISSHNFNSLICDLSKIQNNTCRSEFSLKMMKIKVGSWRKPKIANSAGWDCHRLLGGLLLCI